MSNTLATNRTINEIVGDNSLQGFILKNKVILSVVLALVILAVVAFGFYSLNSHQSNVEYNQKIHTFETTLLSAYQTNPTTQKIAVDGFTTLHKEIGDYAGLFPAALKLGDELVKNNQFKDALSVYTIGKSLAQNDYADYFILSRLASAMEDSGDFKGAVATLEEMNSNKVKIFEGKNYVDLGRLYLKLGDVTKAKTSFTFVVEKAKNDAEFVKVAELYLSKM